jgi:RNA polymerase primary sigma factor
VGLSNPLGGAGEGTLETVLSDRAVTSPLEAIDLQLLRERMAEGLRLLTPRERAVIESLFGLRDGQERTPEEVARVSGIPLERICQIKAQALQKLMQIPSLQTLAELAEPE